MRVLVISPHYDDAPLSVGQSLLDGELARHRVTVGIVFGRTNFVRWFYPSRRRARAATAIRLAEELRNAVRFRYRLRVAGLEEVILRRGETDSSTYLDPSFDPWSSPDLEAVTTLLRRWARNYDVVLVPSAVGDHVDHRLCAAAGAALAGSGTVQVGFYEDRPYASWLDDAALDAALESVTAIPFRAARDISPRLDLELRDVSGPITATKRDRIWYPSQFTPGFIDAMAADIDGGRRERIQVSRDANWPRCGVGGPDGDAA